MRRRKATADILPERLIHKILSCLGYGEAARMSTVSKKWLQAWLTHPNLEFSRDFYVVDATTVDKIMERYWDRNIPIDMFQIISSLRNPSTLREVSPLIDKWLDIALQNGVKHLKFANCISRYRFPIFKLLAAPKSTVRELVLINCHLTLTSYVVNSCNSLKELSLYMVHIDENMLQALLISCPLIVNLIIDNCTGFKKIELQNLKKIKSLNIRIDMNMYVKIQAPTLEHLYYSNCHLKELDIVQCQNLQSLKISCRKISDPDGFLEHLISSSQCLKSLILESCFLGRFNICRSQSLRILKLKNCNIIGEIDAPNLVSLEYKGQIPQLKFAKEAIDHLKHNSHIIFKCWNDLDAVQLCNIGEILSNSISWSQVTLHFSECTEINRKDLQLYHRVATQQVDVLDVHIESPQECPTIVDALLWSCHPRRLNLSSTVETMRCFIDHLMYIRKSSHSSSHGSKPWLSQLKEVKAYKSDRKNQPVELTSSSRRGRRAIRTLTDWEKVYFLLDW